MKNASDYHPLLLSCVLFADGEYHEQLRDSNLKLTLAFGIGMHHAGLHEKDRKTMKNYL